MSRAHKYPAGNNAAGSPLPGEPVYLAVGKLRHAHGVRGEIFMEILTDFPERFQPDTILFMDEGATQLRLIKHRQHKGGLLMTFEGYTTPEAIGQFRNRIVFVKTADRPQLPDGEYYHHQLIGLQVISQDGITIGKVSEILETGANDVLVVRSEAGRETLIPMADEFIQEIVLSKGEITVHLIPGILAEED